MRIKVCAVTGVFLGLVSSGIAAPAPQNDNSYDCSAGPTVYITQDPIDTVVLSLEQPSSTTGATLYSTLVVTATTSPEASTVYITLDPIDTIEIGTPSATHELTSTLTSTETVLATQSALLTSTENVGASYAGALVSHDVSSSIAFLGTTSEPSTTVVVLTSTTVASLDEGETTAPLTNTETVHSTVFITEATTVFTTLASNAASKVSAGFSSGAAAASAIGSSFTGLSPVGWNVTSTFSILQSSIVVSSAPVLSSSTEAVANSYIVSTVSDEPSLYQPWVPSASKLSSFAARSGFGGGYGMTSQVSPVTATQSAFVSATIDGSVVSWPNPYYTGTADSSSAASTVLSTTSSVGPVDASTLLSSPVPYYTPVGTGASRSLAIYSTTLSTSSIPASSSAEAAGSSTLSSVVYYTPTGTAYSSLTVSADPIGFGTSASPPVVYYTPTGTAYSSLATSAEPVASSTTDACASACMIAYNSCRSQVDPNRSTCAAEHASCLGYSPFDNDGSLVTPTACSTTAEATTPSTTFGSASSASSSSSPVVYYTPPSSSGTSSSVFNTTTSSADSIGSSTAPALNSTVLTSSSAVSSSTSSFSLYSTGFITSSSAPQLSNTAPVENSTAIPSSRSSQTSVSPITGSASPIPILTANLTTLTGASGSSQASVAPASSKTSSISASSYVALSSRSSSSFLAGNTGGYSFRPHSTASLSRSSVTMVSPESSSTISQSSTLSASGSFSLNSSRLATISLTDSSASAVITTSYGSLPSSSVNHSTGVGSSGYAGLPTSNTTSTSGSAPSTPTSCGEHGSFTLNWDDLPTLVANNLSDPNTIQPPPIFNPYHQFWFSSGFVDVPLPKDPYNPSSPPHLLEFITSFDAGTDTEAGPDAIDLGTTGEVGNGPYMSLEYLAFNATGASMGCDSTGPDCSFQFTGLRYDPSIEASIEVTTQMIDVPACPALNNCNLVPIALDETFVSLSALRINVTVDGIPKIWFMDDLELGWFNNTCAAGLARQSHR